MQTFLPFPDFAESAECLDRMRLGKQRVETLQIMRALMLGVGWTSHPATLMWRRYEWALLRYQDAICREWVSRGYQDTTYAKTEQLYYERCEWTEEYLVPHWINDRKFHISHQSNLLRKDPIHYYPYFGNISSTLPYVWPEPATSYMRVRKSKLQPWV